MSARRYGSRKVTAPGEERENRREGDGLKEEKLRQRIIKQVYELAFGTNNDAARLVFMDEEEARLCLDCMDLRGVTSVHRAANGGVEVKFADRAGLIELLLEATQESAETGGNGSGLLEAINRAAARMSSGDGSGDEEHKQEN